MSGVKVTVSGDKELREMFRALPKELSDKVMTANNFAAAKIVVEREKLLAPEGPTGNLVDSIGAVRMPKKKAAEVGHIVVGPRRRGRYKGYAGHLVEFGTKERRNKEGSSRGVMPKKPFAKPAFDQTKGQVERAIETGLAKHVVKVMKRYSK